MKGTFFKLSNADFTGQSLPSLNTIVASAQARYAFDFRNGNLDDVTGNTASLVPYRVDNVAHTRTQDATVVQQVFNGLGIKLSGGCLMTSVDFSTIKIDGSTPLSILVVGGWSGEVVTASERIASFLDIGNGVLASAQGAVMQFYNSDGGQIGARVGSSGAPIVGDVVSPTNKLCFMILTFNGTTWTLVNKTTGKTTVKTNAELGITADIPPIPNTAANKVGTKHYLGHAHTNNTLDALPVNLCQVAYWDKVLSPAEIDAQYALSQSMFTGVI